MEKVLNALGHLVDEHLDDFRQIGIFSERGKQGRASRYAGLHRIASRNAA
jgi:hypothetical protein